MANRSFILPNTLSPNSCLQQYHKQSSDIHSQPYNYNFMRTNTSIIFSIYRNKSHGKSLDPESNFLTPQPNKKEQPSTSIIKKTLDQQKGRTDQKIPSQFYLVQSEKIKHSYHPSFNGRKQCSVQHFKQCKNQQLRQTDDSMRPLRQKHQINIGDFKCLKLLGKGRHGKVFLALHHKTGFLGALKIFSKEEFHNQNREIRLKMQEQIIKQFKIQSHLSHTHIIKVYSIFSDRHQVYLFMELGSNGQLFDIFNRRKTFKEETISFIFRSLLQAVKYLHQNNIIHRDIKPQNIVIIHGFPKICDFGQSSICRKDKGQLRQTICGTPLYLSPQMLLGERYDQKIDIWALGAMGYELFTGSNPFNIESKDQLKRIVTEEFKMTNASLQLCNFMTHCLKKNPIERPSAAKLLKHPFIKKWSELQTAEELCH